MTNLPKMLKGSWSNANKIIASEGVGRALGVANALVVVSNTSAGFHRVLLDNQGLPSKMRLHSFWRPASLCALAGCWLLWKVLTRRNQKVSTQHLFYRKAVKKAGKKPNQSVKKRRAPSDDQRDISQYSDPLDDGNLSTPPPSEQWNVVFVRHKDEEVLWLRWKCEATCKLRTSVSMEHHLDEMWIPNVHALQDKFLEDFHEEGKCLLSSLKTMPSGKKRERQRKVHRSSPRNQKQAGQSTQKPTQKRVWHQHLNTF